MVNCLKTKHKENIMKGFKTITFGVLLALISIFSNEEVIQFVAENFPAVGTSLGTAVIILRAVTSSAIFKKD